MGMNQALFDGESAGSHPTKFWREALERSRCAFKG